MTSTLTNSSIHQEIERLGDGPEASQEGGLAPIIPNPASTSTSSSSSSTSDNINNNYSATSNNILSPSTFSTPPTNHQSTFSNPSPSSAPTAESPSSNPNDSPTTPNQGLPSLHSQFKDKDKKWKQMFKFGSIGRKHSNGSQPGTPTSENLQSSYPLPSTTDNSSSIPSAAPTLALHSMGSGSMGFQPMVGSTVVEDPNSLSLSNDSQSSSNDQTPNTSSENQNQTYNHNHKKSSQKSSSNSPRAALQPAVEVLNSSSNLTVPDGNASNDSASGAQSGQRSGSGGSGSGFAARLLRRVSSAPDTNKLFSDGNDGSGVGTVAAAGGGGLGSNGRNNKSGAPTSPSTTTRNGFLSPSENNPGGGGHSQHVSEGSPSNQVSSVRREDGFFPNSPVRMDSTALSFSSKDFEKGRKSPNKNKDGSSTPKSKSGILFPGSGGRSKSGGSKSSQLNGEKKLPSSLQPPSSAAGLAAIQNGANPGSSSNGSVSPNGRSNFRRTYSSNSIKIRDVEVGPNSFSKVKMLGKGDVGKVYLVREKKTEKLFAMKGE